MARLTRQDMKRDEVLETASRFLHYLSEHTRGLVLAVLAVVAMAVVFAGVFAFLQGRSARANALLAEGLAAYEGSVVDSGADPEDPVSPSFASAEARDLRAQEIFQAVESGFGGTSVGRIAGVYLGKLALRSGDTPTAREHWERFLEAGDDHMLTTEVRLNLLALDRSEGKAEEVAEQLREWIASASEELPTDVALDELATTLEQMGRFGEAQDIYQRIVDDFPTSPYSSRARERASRPVEL